MTAQAEFKANEYALVCGYRRFGAVKKLGYADILARVLHSDTVLRIPLNSIYTLKNSRMEENDEAHISLMNSIKTVGLIEPVVVAKTEDLTEQDYIITNLTENFMREGIKPLELSRLILRLQKLGLNNGEISARLSIPRAKIKKLLEIRRLGGEDVLKEGSFMDNRKNRQGKISVSAQNRILTARWNKRKDAQKMLKIAKKREFSIGDIDTLVTLCNAGMTLKQALQESVKYSRFSAQVILDRQELKKYNHNKKDLINLMLKGKIPINPRLVYFEKETQKNGAIRTTRTQEKGAGNSKPSPKIEENF